MASVTLTQRTMTISAGNSYCVAGHRVLVKRRAGVGGEANAPRRCDLLLPAVGGGRVVLHPRRRLYLCDRWHAFRARAREPRLHPTWYCPFVPQYHLRGGPHAGAGESRRVPWAILLRASSTRADRRHASGCRVTSAARRPITVDEWLDRRGRALVPYSSGITALFSSVGSRRRSRPFAVRPDGERLSMCGKRAEASIARRTGVVVRAQGSRSRANVARARRTSGVGGPGVACNSGRTCG